MYQDKPLKPFYSRDRGMSSTKFYGIQNLASSLDVIPSMDGNRYLKRSKTSSYALKHVFPIFGSYDKFCGPVLPRKFKRGSGLMNIRIIKEKEKALKIKLFKAKVTRLENQLKNGNYLEILKQLSSDTDMKQSQYSDDDEIPGLIGDYDSSQDSDSDNEEETKKEDSIRKINAIKKIDFDKTPFDGETTTYLPLIEKLRSKLLENPKTSMQGIEYLLSDHPISGNDENKVDLPEKFILLNVPAILTGGTPLQRKDNLELIKASKAFNTELSDMIAGCRTIVQSLLDSDLYGRINDEIYESCFKSGFQNVIVKEHKEKASDVLDVLNNVTIFLKAKMNNNEKFLPFVEALKKLGKMSTRSDVDIMERLYDNEKGRETLPARLLSTIIFCKTHRKTLKEFIEMASAKDRLDFQRDPLLATSTVNKPKVTNEIKEIKSVQKNSEEACCSLANLKCNVCFNFHHTSKQCALLQADGKTMYYCSLCRSAEPDHEVGQCKNKPPSRYPGNATGGRSEHGGRAGQGGRWGKGGRGGRGNQGGRGPKGNFDKTKEATSVNAISVTNTKVNRDFGFLDSSEESGDDNDHECDKFNVNAIANKESLRNFMHNTDFIKTLGSPSSKKVRSLKLKTLRLKGGFTEDAETETDEEAVEPVRSKLRYGVLNAEGQLIYANSSFHLEPKDVYDQLNKETIRTLEQAVAQTNKILFDVRHHGSSSTAETTAMDNAHNFLKQRVDTELRPYRYRYKSNIKMVRNNAWFVQCIILQKITVEIPEITARVLGPEETEKVIASQEARNKHFASRQMCSTEQSSSKGKSLTVREVLPNVVRQYLSKEQQDDINEEIENHDDILFQAKNASNNEKAELSTWRTERFKRKFDYIWLTKGFRIAGVQIEYSTASGAGFINRICIEDIPHFQERLQIKTGEKVGSTRLHSETIENDTEVNKRRKVPQPRSGHLYPRTSRPIHTRDNLRVPLSEQGILSHSSDNNDKTSDNGEDEEVSEDEKSDDISGVYDPFDETESKMSSDESTNCQKIQNRAVYSGKYLDGGDKRWVATLLTFDTVAGEMTDLNEIMQETTKLTVQFGNGVFLKPITVKAQLMETKIGSETRGFYRITAIVSGMVDKSVNGKDWENNQYPYKGKTVVARGVVYEVKWIAKVWFRTEGEFKTYMFKNDFECQYANGTHFGEN